MAEVALGRGAGDVELAGLGADLLERAPGLANDGVLRVDLRAQRPRPRRRPRAAPRASARARGCRRRACARPRRSPAAAIPGARASARAPRRASRCAPRARARLPPAERLQRRAPPPARRARRAPRALRPLVALSSSTVSRAVRQPALRLGQALVGLALLFLQPADLRRAPPHAGRRAPRAPPRRDGARAR